MLSRLHSMAPPRKPLSEASRALTSLSLYLLHPMSLSISASPTSFWARAGRHQDPLSPNPLHHLSSEHSLFLCLRPCPMTMAPQLSPGILQSLLKVSQSHILTPPIPSWHPGTVVNLKSILSLPCLRCFVIPHCPQDKALALWAGIQGPVPLPPQLQLG